MFKKILKSYDYSLIVVIVLLSLFGLVMVYSASMVIASSKYEVSADFFYQKQKLHLILSLLVFLVVAFVPYKLYQHKYVLMTIFGMSIGVLLLIDLVGKNVNNAQSWLSIGGLNLQPSELIKLGMIVYLAAVYAKKQKYIDNFNVGVLPPIVFLVVICFLVAMQPDFGTALIIFLIGASIIMSSGMSFKSIMKLVGIASLVALLLAPIVYVKKDDIFTESKMGRLNSFVNPFEYEDTDGYQLVNSYLAIGNGGVGGQGLGESTIKYGYLPEAHTDFIMAIISEELGAKGVLFVLFALAYIVLKGYRIAGRCRDPFGSLLAIGIASMIGVQSFINLAGLTGLIPITGVPLPFVSYGGSSLILLAVAMGVLLNVSMFTNYEEKYKHPKESEIPINETNYQSKGYFVQ